MTAKLGIRRRVQAATAASLLIAASGCAHAPRYRYFQPSADQIGVQPNSYGEAVLPRHGLIVVQGDDFAYGRARGRTRWRINGAEESQAAVTISVALRKVIKGVRIENRGYPGDTAIQSAVRWQGAAAPDLLVLCLGYGDLQAHTPPADFRVALSGLIREAQAHGSTVFVVLPPSFAQKDLPFVNSRLSLYRIEADTTGRQAGAEVFDASTSMARIQAPPPKTFAQTAAVYQAVAADLAPYIRVVAVASPRGPASPQTGQAGSTDSRTVRDSAPSPS